MTTPPQSPVTISLAAHVEERFVAPARRNPLRSRTGFFVIVALVLLVHAGVLGYLLHRDATTPFALPPEETPVEVVVEPPPPPPPPPEQEAQKPPPPPPPPEMEKPATSAPRASKETAKTKGTAEKTLARKTAAPPRDGQPDPAKDDAAAVQPAAPDAPAQAALKDDRREAEALDKATPDPADKPDPKVTPKPIDTAKADPARQLSGLTEAPDNNFADPTPLQQFPEGTEDNRYLAVVYGQVMSKNRYHGSAAERRHASGVVSVVFVVDPFGHVQRQEVIQSSGQADLDALAMGAVRTAGPFPPPPGSGPQQLVATIAFGSPAGK